MNFFSDPCHPWFHEIFSNEQEITRESHEKLTAIRNLFLCLFVIFVAKKLSSVIIFALFKEIERPSYKRYCVGCSVQTAEVLRFLKLASSHPNRSRQFGSE